MTESHYILTRNSCIPRAAALADIEVADRYYPTLRAKQNAWNEAFHREMPILTQRALHSREAATSVDHSHELSDKGGVAKAAPCRVEP